MSAQEILIEEIKRQPESVLRELLLHLKRLAPPHARETVTEDIVADTWEKLGPPPDVDYDQL